jgi:small GTP-binding protein
MSQGKMVLKIVLLGDGAVGKTAIQTRYTKGFFREDYKVTIGMQYAVKVCDIVASSGQKQQLRLQIWDLAGQERFHFMRSAFIEGSKGAVLVYDVTKRKSFDNLDAWLTELSNAIGGKVPMVLVGNKTDLPDRVVSSKEGKAFAKKNGLAFLEASAKTGDQIDDVFMEIGKLIVSEI